MFIVQDVLVSDDVADARFACNLGACLGACCVQGDSGAPLLQEEIDLLEEILPRVKKWLRPEAIEVIERNGCWELSEEGEPATTCVDDKECVFVYYENTVAKCAVQRLHDEEGSSFPKPLSCHLFPLRIEQHGGREVINYEQLKICDPGRKEGATFNVDVSTFLREPLVRKYGADWYEEFCSAIDEQRIQY